MCRGQHLMPGTVYRKGGSIGKSRLAEAAGFPPGPLPHTTSELSDGSGGDDNASEASSRHSVDVSHLMGGCCFDLRPGSAWLCWGRGGFSKLHCVVFWSGALGDTRCVSCFVEDCPPVFGPVSMAFYGFLQNMFHICTCMYMHETLLFSPVFNLFGVLLKSSPT